MVASMKVEMVISPDSSCKVESFLMLYWFIYCHYTGATGGMGTKGFISLASHCIMCYTC